MDCQENSETEGINSTQNILYPQLKEEFFFLILWTGQIQPDARWSMSS